MAIQINSDYSKFKTAAGDDYKEIIAEIESGGALSVTCGDVAFVLRAEITEARRELVIVCAEGQGLAAAAAKIYRVAQRSGFDSIRIHNSRPAITSKLLKRYAFKEVERVYRLKVDKWADVATAEAQIPVKQIIAV